MKNRIFFAFLVMPLILPFLDAQTVKFMTYNIRLDVASDGENDWAHRREGLAAQINFYEPDVLGTQEGLPHQIAYLQKNLDKYESEGMGREGLGKGESTHIFYNKSKFSLLEGHTFWLSKTPDTVSMGWDAACLRVCTGILLKNKKNKQKFWVFNTHLDHIGSQARKNSVDLILSKIKTYNKHNLPVIFMGDFNSEPEDAPIDRVKTEMFDSRAVSEATPFGPEGTFNGFKFEESVVRLIDYVFVSKSPFIKVKKYAILSDSKNLRYPSDHLPVYIEVNFN